MLPRRPGARRPAPSPTPTAPSTCPRRPWSRRARPGRTSRSSSTTRGAWASATRTGGRCSTGTTPEEAFDGVAGVLRRPALRLHRAQLRPAARRRRHPVAVHRATHPDGTERLYADGRFWTDAGRTARRTATTSSPARAGRRTSTGALNPDGKARAQGRRVPAAARAARRRVPVAADHRPHALPLPHAHQDRPRAAAPGGGPGRLGGDARGRTPPRLGIAEGDLVASSRDRGAVARRRGSDGIRDGLVFLPFHYAEPTAANELTMTRLGPVSKQPQFKGGSVRVRVSPAS